jgi:hypothetical protein
MQLLPNAKLQFVDQNGAPLAGGSVYYYAPGTTNPLPTFQDKAGTIQNTNPVLLDSRGQAIVWGSGTYRQVVCDASGVTIWDQIVTDASTGLIQGQLIDEVFNAGADFTAGTTTVLTLANVYGAEGNVSVVFDGITQSPTTYTLNFKTLTFNAPIPVGVLQVWVKGGVTLPINTPAAGSVVDTTVAPGSALYNRINHRWDVTDPNFGACGDGVTDDSAAINKAFQLAANVGGEVYFPSSKTFLIKSPLTCSVQVPLQPVIGTNYQLYFSDIRTVSIVSPGRSTIRAGASMTTMLTIQYANGNIAPYYTKIDGLVFDGNGLATNGVLLNYSTRSHVVRNSFVGMSGYGLANAGYGVAEFLYNTFATTIGIQVQQGGDTLMDHNDFYAPANSNGHIGIDMQGWSGNTHIHNSTWTADPTSSNETPILLHANISAQTGREVRDVTIKNNEFCGYDLPISGVAGSNNMYNCIISGNHKTALSGTKISAALISLTGPGQFIISDNIVGNAAYPVLSGNVISLANASRMTIKGNKFANLLNTPIVLTNVVQSKVYDNEFYDVGQSLPGNAIIYLGSTCATNEFYRNTYNQSQPTYGQVGIVENTGCNFNTATNETFIGINQPYTVVGANSNFKLTSYGSAAPVSGTHGAGEIVWNTNLSNSAGVPVGFVCVAGGSPGTWRSFGVTV